MATILVVDDEKNYLWMLGELFQGEGYEVLTCGRAGDALPLLAEGRVDLLLTDLRMAEMDGMALLARAREVSPATSTIIMTAFGTVERAVEAMRLGAYDFILKPFNNADLLRTIAKALERTVLLRENRRLSQTLSHQYRFDQLIGKSSLMREVFEKIKRVTNSKSPVLITGESGSGKVVPVDVRILAATHRDLKTEVQAGRFREDLFFRLNVVRIDVPPLRDRAEDIPLLAVSCLKSLVKEGEVRGTRLAPTAIELLVRHFWPGNVRELENVVAHAALMAKSEEIQPDDLPLELTAAKEWLTALDRLLPAKAPLDATLKAIERHLVHRALAQSNGVQAKAAELLGISRSLLRYKLKTLGEPSEPPS